MTKTSGATQSPPRELMAAMEAMRAGDNAAALDLAETALPTAGERAPLLAIASMAALRTGQPARAIPHLRALLTVNPADQASRFNLANALVEIGDLDSALTLARDGNGPQFARVEGYVHQQRGENGQAIAAYRRALDANPSDLAAWNNMANTLFAEGAVDDAIAAYERALAIAPLDVGIHLSLADALRQADRGPARLSVMREAYRLAPSDRRVRTELALAQAHVEDLDSAIATLEAVVTDFPDFGESHIELGRLYEALNRVDDLARFIGQIDMTAAPPEVAFLQAWQAQREGRFDDAAAFADSIPETIHPMRRLNLIGLIADRRGDAARAFDAFERMNRAALDDTGPGPSPSFRESLEQDLAGWSDSWASTWQTYSIKDGHRDPVFLVGFPRSGTTLLDTMLMGQADLSVLEERPMLAEVAHAAKGEDLALMSEGRVTELRRVYFDKAREDGWDNSRWLLDKHPLNMVRGPLIHRLFPSARVILAERHPYDVVLSAFMANFTLNFAMRSFTSLEEAARTYDAVFSSWERARVLFPMATHAVRYERLVADTRAELAPLLEWLGLGWTDRVLTHQKTASERGRVRTASYSQISEKLYSRAVYRWRKYGPQLEPVIPILQPWAEHLHYDVD